jgi:transcriptional regulator with XRE-family HTH domain
MSLNEIIRVGSRIKHIRKERGFSQKHVAEKTNISYTTYSNYENNNRVPKLGQLKSIADFFEVPITDLLGVSSNLIMQPLEMRVAFFNLLLVMGYDVGDSEYVDKWGIQIRESSKTIYLTKDEMDALEDSVKENIDLRINKYLHDGKHNQ